MNKLIVIFSLFIVMFSPSSFSEELIKLEDMHSIDITELKDKPISELSSVSKDRLFVLSNYLLENREYKKGFDILQKIKNEYPRSYFLIGEYYYDSNNPDYNPEKAIENYQIAIQEDTDLKNDSYERIGDILYSGNIGSRENKAALENWKMSSSLGNKDASFKLGSYYQNEETDLETAAYWYSQAIEQGSREAINNQAILAYSVGDIKTSIELIKKSIILDYLRPHETLVEIIKDNRNNESVKNEKQSILNIYKEKVEKKKIEMFKYHEILAAFGDKESISVLTKSFINLEKEGAGKTLTYFGFILFFLITISLIIIKILKKIRRKND